MFIRPATEDDFKNYEVQFDYNLYMSEDVKRLIERNKIYDAVRLAREETGLGMQPLKEHCDEYHKYVQAKRDFEKGKPVFVPY